MSIYNWAEMPEEVKYMATDEDGWAWQYLSEPERHDIAGEWVGDLPSIWSKKAFIRPDQNPFKGDWRESLEARPAHPCSGKCPRYNKEACGTCLVGEGA